MSDLHSLKVSCQNEPKFYVSLFSREEQDIHLPQAGNLIKQLFSLEIADEVIFAGLEAGFGDVPPPWAPEELQGSALVSPCPWAESSLLSQG